jgi:putative PIN family toxin of toxin-antitoxin system
MAAERVVLDTNILISAALLPGKPYEVLRQVLDHERLIFSDESFEELASRLLRSKFDRYVGLETRRRLILDLAAAAEWTAITGALRACQDPEDDKILETAFAGSARYVVTGDKDLLLMHPFRGLAIITPSAFLGSD